LRVFRGGEVELKNAHLLMFVKIKIAPGINTLLPIKTAY